MTTETAIKYLKTFFSNSSASIVSLQEAYSAAGLNLEDKEKNRMYIGNKLMYLKRLNFVKPVYEKKNNKNILIGIEITEEGSNALRGEVDNQKNAPSLFPVQEKDHVPEGKENGTHKNPQMDVIQLITNLSNKIPNRKITYDINGGTLSIQ